MGEPPRREAKSSGGPEGRSLPGVHVRAAIVGFSRRGAWHHLPELLGSENGTVEEQDLTLQKTTGLFVRGD
jgi:hypothetical protein